MRCGCELVSNATNKRWAETRSWSLGDAYGTFYSNVAVFLDSCAAPQVGPAPADWEQEQEHGGRASQVLLISDGPWRCLEATCYACSMY